MGGKEKGCEPVKPLMPDNKKEVGEVPAKEDKPKGFPLEHCKDPTYMTYNQDAVAATLKNFERTDFDLYYHLKSVALFKCIDKILKPMERVEMIELEEIKKGRVPKIVSVGTNCGPVWAELPGKITKGFLNIENVNDVLMIRPFDIFRKLQILGNLIEKLVSEMRNPVIAKRETFVRNMCLLKCDEIWFRAACTDSKDGRIYCYLLDGGFFTWATYANMIPMTQRMVNLLPFQAIECDLGGIKRNVPYHTLSFMIYQFLGCSNGTCYAISEPYRSTGLCGGPSYHVNILNRYGMSLNQFLLDFGSGDRIAYGGRFLRDAYIIERTSVDCFKDCAKKKFSVGCGTENMNTSDVATSTADILAPIFTTSVAIGSDNNLFENREDDNAKKCQNHGTCYVCCSLGTCRIRGFKVQHKSVGTVPPSKKARKTANAATSTNDIGDITTFKPMVVKTADASTSTIFDECD